MTIRLHNTLTKNIDELRPLSDNRVTMYSCGPTVYDHVHIGNLSAFITADILRRVVASNGIDVKHVMNFTDVDDKTIRRSHEKYPDFDAMDALRKLTAEYSKLFLLDMQAIGNNIEALTFIRAADDETIEGMRQLISELHDKGFAYIADDGVYFSIDAYKKSGKKYGQLVDITDESTGSERIQNDEYDKESAHDFALWKKQKDGEPAWEFTLDGTDLLGRPGWHIECSVMSRMELGQPFDIHTGGIDLAFPHHENEIAQSTAGHDDPNYAQVFVHNEHILVDGKKMAKSANNFYTLSDLKEKGVDPLAFRLLVLQSHYRKPTNFSLENAQAAHNRLRHWRTVSALRHQTHEMHSNGDNPSLAVIGKIREALNDDLNTPEALRIIDEAFSYLEAHKLESISHNSLVQLLEAIDDMLGLQLLETTADITNEQKQLIMERQRAREAKDWERSDQIRDELAKQGIVIRDSASGAIWEYA
ncbi:MAG: cysteine--tRNA ligase [Candidatus Nomurabacteria bacterium]|nr:MAG: cysteine--tRNA ligase [Candidatus Nomurabacteria bacterium]